MYKDFAPFSVKGLSSFFVLFLILGTFVLFVFSVSAQQDSIEIAKTYIISGDIVPSSGDIVAFSRDTQTFFLADQLDDENLFGIVVEDPLLVLEIDNGGVPVVRSGEVFVNVTTANGVIVAGDYVTSSIIPGKGQKAAESDTYIVGIALDSLSPPSTTTTDTTGGSVFGGQIRVLLSIGTKEQAEAQFKETGDPQDTGITEATILNIIQYFIAAFIAVGSIYIAFKNFGPNIRNGIISVGRNPLAKSSIQTMIILNVVLIVLVGGGGLFVGLAILLLPI